VIVDRVPMFGHNDEVSGPENEVVEEKRGELLRRNI
jgi:hypothetical protein